MGMFSKERFLGVDFGTESIKAVEVELRGGRPFLTNYGEAQLFPPHDPQKPAVRSFREDMAVRFRVLLEKMKPETKEVCISMPSFLGLISLIEFPEMTDAELEEAVKFEARKYIPSPLEDVSLSWESIGGSKDGNSDNHEEPKKRKTEVLLVAALNKDVWQYQGYVNAVSYKMKLLELETFSIVRAVVGSTPGTFLVIDIGARAANIILVEDGYVKKSRSIDAGGRDITRSLAESLNISPDRADSLKKSGKDFLNAKDVAVIFPAIETIVSEATRMADSWKAKRPDGKIDSIILSGGTGRLTGLVQYFTKKLGIPATLSDPWQMVSYPPILQPKIESIGAAFSAAIGLALYGSAEAEKRKKNQS
ncbi:MAG: type IV pilus assembly protein PilM [Candidatus Moranbacteria bacterium]|nr:type IV pilus assembly protein PilM [Candidatus Moranbacteria bacterium]